MSIGSPPAVALIAGATASGKSSLAMALAATRPATIVNADSAQVYADLRFLTARPAPSDEAAVPHRLFGTVDGAHPCSAAEWAAAAAAAVDEAHRSGRLPILVGGTGLYLRTLLDGIAPVPAIDPAVRAAVRAMAVEAAHTALSSEDPAAAARLNPADTSRVARALEVVRSTGRPIAAWQAERHGGIADRIRLVPVLLTPDRAWLGERIAERFGGMLREGATTEVERLLARGLSPSLPVMRAIGVREIAGWLAGDWSRDEAVARAVLATRRYAKRQDTWFRNQPPADWPRETRPPDAAMLDGLSARLAAAAAPH